MLVEPSHTPAGRLFLKSCLTNGGAPEGISTAELKGKTGLAERQIWNIVNRASKLGKIKKVKRGVYGASLIKEAYELFHGETQYKGGSKMPEGKVKLFNDSN
jgi:hypothetical protein